MSLGHYWSPWKKFFYRIFTCFPSPYLSSATWASAARNTWWNAAQYNKFK